MRGPGAMKPEIRYLTPADYRLFSEIRLAALRSEPDAFGELYENVAGRTPADWKVWLANAIVAGRKNSVCVVANGKAVGMCGFGISDAEPTEGYLGGMFVERGHRGHGWGRRLLEEAERWLSAHGVLRLKACVAAPNEQAIGFYRRNGYVIGPPSGTLRPGSPIPVYPIEKALKGDNRKKNDDRNYFRS